MKYSTTQLLTLASVISKILTIFGVTQIGESEIGGFLTVGAFLVGFVIDGIAWVRRWKQGGVTFGGFKK